MLNKLRYSSGVVRGCYFRIEPTETLSYNVELEMPTSKKTTVAKNEVDAKEWVDRQVQRYLANVGYY